MQQKPRKSRMPAPSGIIPRKSLGQHFLRDPEVIRKIVASLNLSPQDNVLEIGCGTGALTVHLAGKVRKFVGVELDVRLFRRLNSSLAGTGVRFLHGDVLALDLSRLAQEFSSSSGKIKVVGNLPYYLSSPIIEWLGHYSEVIHSATIMLQAEVADRLQAAPGGKEYGVLTVMTSYHFLCRRLFEVRPGSFKPVPKVSSAVVRLEPRSARPLRLSEEEPFFDFVKRSFSQRRKTMKNCLKGRVDLERLEAGLARLGHAPDARAEVLTLDEFIELFETICLERHNLK